MATKKYVSLEKLTKYDELLKAKIAADDAAALQSAKDYADSLAGNYDAAGSAATAKSEAIAAAATETERQVKALADGAVKANADAIAAIKDDANVDSFADVVAELAKKQDAGDYATKSEAQGYANAKDEAIAAAQAAADAAQADATANAQAIEAINHAETGILAQAKSFATTEDAKVQQSVDTLAGKVGTVPEGSTVMGIITNIQENAYDDTALVERIDGIDEKVTTLVGEDANKSVRAIAAEELAAQLVAEGAAEALDTLEEIAAWIQSHPDDAAAMNEAILALQNKLTLGTYVDGEETKEYATVKAYVEAAIAALNIGDYAVAADLTALAGRVTALETASATHALKTEVQAVADALNEYKDAHKDDYTNAQVDAAIKVVADDVAALGDTYATDEELAQAIADAKADASNKDAVVLAEAQKASAAVQTALDTHTGKTDIHVTTEQKTAWTTAAGKAHEHSNLSVLEGVTAEKVAAWDKVSAKADATALQAEIERATAAEQANAAAIAAFVEVSEAEINALFGVNS
jgi:hypothetical protein